MRENRTAGDAFDRVIDAKMGSLVDPSLKYIDALTEQLENWLYLIRTERYKISERERLKEVARNS